MNTAGAATDGADPVTGCEVVLHIFDTPSAEMLHRLRPPWPRSLRRLYELAGIAQPEIDVETGMTTLSAAVLAVREELAHRLDLLAFVVFGLEELGWDIRLVDENLVATADLTPEEAREQLEDRGITGPMCLVADLDDSGWPTIRPLDAPLVGDVR
jgi:hypothetical protein